MTATPAPRPRVVLIGAGGTIGSLGRHALDWEYMDHGLREKPEALLERIPEATREIDVVPVAFRPMSSAKLGPPEWLEINELVHAVVERERPAGVVLTHGTATLEETAYFLNLALKTDVALVVVGSQRPANMISSDAAMNLLGALRVAGSPAARGLGVLVLLNDEIQAAREVTKTSTSRLETFRSPDLGMLGYADADGCVAIYRRPARRHAPDTEFDVRGRRELPRVDIACSYDGADGTAIEAFVAPGARAVTSSIPARGSATSSGRRGRATASPTCTTTPAAIPTTPSCQASSKSSPPAARSSRLGGTTPNKRAGTSGPGTTHTRLSAN
jgi:L-asparaginase